jgi:hypothetical protein
MDTHNEMGNNRFQVSFGTVKPGAVYHCDSLILDKKVIFSLTSKYLATWKFHKEVEF